MLMVIFGAGASFDSYSALRQGEKPEMPLANDLFSEDYQKLRDQFPIIGSLLPYVQKTGRDFSLEEQLSLIDAERQSDPVATRQMLGIQFYLQALIKDCEKRWKSRIGQSSNYKTLLNSLRKYPVPTCFVTFNYDTLLEQALEFEGLNFPTISHYISHDRISVLKLHGSVNWRRGVTGPFYLGNEPSATKLITVAEQIRETHEIILENEPSTTYIGPNFPGWIPSLAVPIAEKRTFSCPPEHVKRLDEVIPQVKRVLVIGWRGAEKHFVERLRALPPGVKGTIVCGNRDDANETMGRLGQAGVPGSFGAEPSGFTEFVRSRRVDVLMQGLSTV